MPGLIRITAVSVILMFTFTGAIARPNPADDHNSIVIVFKGGHRQTLATSEVQRIDLKAPAMIIYKDGHREKITGEVVGIEFSEQGLSAMTPTRSHYIGKWEVGEGNGGRFFITLESNGDARKTIGSTHGTWTLVDGEARIAWDDGWHDVIRKVGTRHEKRAYEPGRSYDDEPSNVTEARNTEVKPI